MAITWGERPNTTTTEGKDSATKQYVLTGTPDQAVAYAFAAGYSPAMHGSLYRSKIGLKEEGSLIWGVEVQYGPIKEPEAGDFSWTFDTTGATKHVTQAIQHIKSYPAPGRPAIPHDGTIGAQGNGEVAGVDVTDRAFKWTETHQLLLSSYGFSYSTTLGDSTGKMNDAAFRGFPAHSVKFLGASGKQSTKDPLLLEVSYSFEVSPNEAALVCGPIKGIKKDGWDYSWMTYEQAEAVAVGKVTPQLLQVDVDRVIYECDFSLLGIGTGVL